MTDLTAGKKYDRVSQTWIPAAEYDARKADLEERAFQRKGSQGQLAAPMVISDTQRGLMSMTNGKIYDSKSEMRKEYRRAGVEEVGNEKLTRGRSWADEKRYRAKQREEIKGALLKANSQMGLGAP